PPPSASSVAARSTTRQSPGRCCRRAWRPALAALRSASTTQSGTRIAGSARRLVGAASRRVGNCWPPQDRERAGDLRQAHAELFNRQGVRASRRQRAGGCPYRFLNARLNAASDVYPTLSATSPT